MELAEEIYCEVHGTIHDKTTDPYGYNYALTGEEPECGPNEWRLLWIGRQLQKGDSDGSV